MALATRIIPAQEVAVASFRREAWVLRDESGLGFPCSGKTTGSMSTHGRRESRTPRYESGSVMSRNARTTHPLPSTPKSRSTLLSV